MSREVIAATRPMDLHDGDEWSEIDIFDLKNSLAHKNFVAKGSPTVVARSRAAFRCAKASRRGRNEEQPPWCRICLEQYKNSHVTESEEWSMTNPKTDITD